MRKLFCILAVLLSLSEISLASDTFFSDIYENVKNSATEKGKERVSRQMGFSKGTLQSILDKGIDSEELEPICIDECQKICQESECYKACQKITTNQLQACYAEIENLYYFESNLAKIENMEKELAYAEEIWSNGTLADSDFDLVVDLNIIDVLYFGSEANIPESNIFELFEDDDNQAGDYNGSSSTNSSQQNNAGESGDETDNANDDSNETGDDKTDDDTSGTDDSADDNTGNDNTDTDGDNTEEEDFSDQACVDPHILQLNTGSLSLAMSSDSANNSVGTTSTSTTTDQSSSQSGSGSGNNSGTNSAKAWLINSDYSNAANDYKGGTYPTFSDTDGGDNQCADSGFSMFGNMYCVPEFCNQFLCVKIRFIAGQAKASSTEKSVKGIINTIYQVLEEADKQKERLNPTQNTTVHWDIRNMHLGDFNLQVVTEKKSPVQGNYKTADAVLTTVEEFRNIQSKSFPIAGALANTENKKLLKNAEMFAELFLDHCQGLLVRMPNAASQIELFQACQKITKVSKPALKQENQEALQELKIEILETKNLETKKNYWTEIRNQLRNFTSSAKAINDSLFNLTSVKQINAKKVDCKTMEP